MEIKRFRNEIFALKLNFDRGELIKTFHELPPIYLGSRTT